MGCFNNLQQLVFGAPMGWDGAALILFAEIERIELIVADRKNAGPFRGRRKPQAGVACFSDFRHFLNQIAPTDIEYFQHRFAARAIREREGIKPEPGMQQACERYEKKRRVGASHRSIWC